MLVETLIK